MVFEGTQDVRWNMQMQRGKVTWEKQEASLRRGKVAQGELKIQLIRAKHKELSTEDWRCVTIEGALRLQEV